jgi:hypothetical protein
MCLPENVLATAIDRDLISFILKHPGFNPTDRHLYLRIGSLFGLFVDYYGFKYQKHDKIIINNQDIINSLRRLKICSIFKFKQKKPKRCKILKRKVRGCY